MEGDLVREGKEQIKVGLELIVWSKLACWDKNDFKLVANNADQFEGDQGHERFHNRYGRLICWIIFCVGAEYLGKGFCLVNGHNLSKLDKAIQTPDPRIDFGKWIELASQYEKNKQKTKRIECDEKNYGTLGGLRGVVSKYIEEDSQKNLVEACYRYLASTIRNRDVHYYAKERRRFDFHMVEKLFVPAFNIVLKSVEQKHPGFCSQWEHTY